MSMTIQGLTTPQRITTQALTFIETFRNKSLGKFTEDTAISLGSRLGASRSSTESTEIAFVEILESVLAYFVPGLLANQVFGKLLFRAGKLNDTRLLSQPLEKIYQEGGTGLLKKALPHRLATLLASIVFTAVCGEYILLFLKNLMTLNVNKTGSFNDLANLNNKSISSPPINTQVKEKAHKRIKQLLILSSGILISSFALMKSKGLNTLISKLANKYKPDNRLGKLIHSLDFDYSRGKAAMKFPAHLALYMGISFIGYLDSARNKLERQEVATRLPLIMGYMLVGQSLISKILNKTIFKNPDIHNQDTQTLLKNLFQKNENNLSKHLKQQKILPQKLLATFLPYIIGGGIVSFGVAMLSRLLTQNRFDKNVKEEQIINFRVLAKNNADQPLRYQSALFKTLENQAAFLPTKEEPDH